MKKKPVHRQCPFGTPFRYLGTWVLFSLVVPIMLPTKELPRARRLALLTERAFWRHRRRLAVLEWFWIWADKRWGKPPNLSTKVSYHVVRHLPEFATVRPSISRYRHRSGTGVRIVADYICYEDCVHLADLAYMLLARLERST